MGELMKIGEVLFQPQMILKDKDDSIKSVTDLVKSAVMSCDIDLRKKLLNNIYLSGGVTTMRGFMERFIWDLKQNMPYQNWIKVYGDERRYATWIGGAVLSNLEEFVDNWEWKEDWEEKN